MLVLQIIRAKNVPQYLNRHHHIALVGAALSATNLWSLREPLKSINQVVGWSPGRKVSRYSRQGKGQRNLIDSPLNLVATGKKHKRSNVSWKLRHSRKTRRRISLMANRRRLEFLIRIFDFPNFLPYRLTFRFLRRHRRRQMCRRAKKPAPLVYWLTKGNHPIEGQRFVVDPNRDWHSSRRKMQGGILMNMHR